MDWLHDFLGEIGRLPFLREDIFSERLEMFTNPLMPKINGGKLCYLVLAPGQHPSDGPAEARMTDEMRDRFEVDYRLGHATFRRSKTHHITSNEVVINTSKPGQWGTLFA
jgi:hypothetical protein